MRGDGLTRRRRLPLAVVALACLTGCAASRRGDAPCNDRPLVPTPPSLAATADNGEASAPHDAADATPSAAAPSAPALSASLAGRLVAASFAAPSAGVHDATGGVTPALADETSAEGLLGAPPEVPAAVPIDFGAALALAAGENPQVAVSRQRINEAYAQLQTSRVLWAPSLRAGLNYNKHEGAIQDVAGSMIETSRGSVYSGLGAQAVGAGSPAVPGVVMSFHTKDAVFQPRIAQQLVAATRQANRAAVNDILLETAVAYNRLLQAHEVAAVADDTLANIQKLADATADYAQAGQGPQADADRAQAELAARRVEAQRALEAVQVASVRLARVLSQDPATSLLPQEPSIAPIELAPIERSLPDLIATGLSQRPELAESRHLVGAAIERLGRERNAPLVPSVLLGLSYGGNGGGLGDVIDDFGDRMDFDAVAYWEVRNLGLGEQAARRQARSAVEQARWEQVRLMDQVASDVAEAYAQVVARRAQIESAQAGIAAARASYVRNADRIQEGVGLPIEALQSIQALDAAQRQYVQCVTDYNDAQFRLQRALGWPIE